MPARALFLVEVSVSSFAYDRDVKARLYAEERVPEYWIVDVKKRVVHVFDKPRKGVYSRHRAFKPEDSVSSPAFPDVEIPVGEVLP